MPCAPGMSKCKIGCLHREMVRDYQMERERQETDVEERYRETDGEDVTLIDFKTWLRSRTRY